MLYQFLIANGRADFQMIREFFPEFPFEELFRLVNEKKVSVHYEQLGKAWYRAPYYRSRPKDPVREYVLKNPGVSPTEVMKALEMNRATFYKRVKELGIITEKDGNNAKLYVEEDPQEDPFKQFQKDPSEDRGAVHYSPTRSKPQEARSEPVEEPEDLFEGLDGEALIVARGVQEGKWAISEPGCVVLGIDPKKFNWNKGGSFSSGNMNDKVYHALYYYTESRELYELEHFVNIPLNEDWRRHWEFSDEIADWFTDGEFEWSDVEDTGMPEKVADEAMKYLLINGVIKSTGEGSWK